MNDPHIRAQLIRALLNSVDDSGAQQLVAVTGLAGQTIGQAVRSQHFGLTSNPPAQAEGLMLAMGGGFDRLHALGFEHPQHRPTGLASGATTLYDANGNRWDLTSTGAKLTDKTGNVIETKSDRVYVKPASTGIIVFLGGDGATGTYDFVKTVSAAAINVKARIS